MKIKRNASDNTELNLSDFVRRNEIDEEIDFWQRNDKKSNVTKWKMSESFESNQLSCGK